MADLSPQELAVYQVAGAIYAQFLPTRFVEAHDAPSLLTPGSPGRGATKLVLLPPDPGHFRVAVLEARRLLLEVGRVTTTPDLPPPKG